MSTTFMFNGSSACKLPGTGVMEMLSDYDRENNVYADLEKISNWRKILSNDYKLDLEVDGNIWSSVDIYCIAEVLKSDMYDTGETYKHLMKGGIYDTEKISILKTRFKLQKRTYDITHLRKALYEKFSYKHPVALDVLISTKSAILSTWKRGGEVCMNEDGNKMAPPNEYTDLLMKIRVDRINECKTNAQQTIDTNDDIVTSTIDGKSGRVESDIQVVKNDNVGNSQVTNDEVILQTTQTTQPMEIKILSKKEIDDYGDFMSKYDPSKNKSSNRLTIYEKTNIIGVRMEQLSFGCETFLDDDVANALGDVKLIAHQEFATKKIPFILCRILPNQEKEYWRLKDMQ